MIHIVNRALDGQFVYPSGRDFDGCVAGFLLVLAPYIRGDEHVAAKRISRSQCLDMNAIAAELVRPLGKVIIKPDGFSIPADSVAVHGITTERALREGLPLNDVLEEFATDLSIAEYIVGHNIDFDQHIVGAELCRIGMNFNALMDKPCTCTMKTSTKFCAIPNPNIYFGGYKWPSLQELYQKLFNRSFEDAHDALADITATKDCYFELKRRGII